MSATDRSASASFWAVIPAGGAGTRLWPLSRAARPKFLLPLTGERSLVQQTADRLAPLVPPERTLVVCGPAHAAAVARQLPELPEANILVEPAPRGSGPAIALAATLIARRDPDAAAATAIMGSFAADHAVTDEDAFRAAVRTAIAAAEEDELVTIGLTPTRPETGYGYLERTDEAVCRTAEGTAYRAARFVEKPDLATASAYVASGRFLWNASMFVWRVDVFLAELKRLLPELHAALQAIADAWETPERERLTAARWGELREVTIDHGVMEHAARVAVVPAELGWSDVGDWHGLGELSAADDAGNAALGDALLLASSGCVVRAESGRVVALLGVEDLVVVDTADALLVASRGRAQEVKRIVDELKRRERHDLC